MQGLPSGSVRSARKARSGSTRIRSARSQSLAVEAMRGPSTSIAVCFLMGLLQALPASAEVEVQVEFAEPASGMGDASAAGLQWIYIEFHAPKEAVFRLDASLGASAT